MDEETRTLLLELLEGQKRLLALITGMHEDIPEESSTDVDLPSAKTSSLEDRMAFVEKKVQDNERKIFTLKNEYK